MIPECLEKVEKLAKNKGKNRVKFQNFRRWRDK